MAVLMIRQCAWCSSVPHLPPFSHRIIGKACRRRHGKIANSANLPRLRTPPPLNDDRKPSMFNKLHAAARQVSQIVVGKDQQVRLALTCLLAGGHLLIDDVPGVGKTTLAHALALALGLKFNRVQFTSDLLPAD